MQQDIKICLPHEFLGLVQQAAAYVGTLVKIRDSVANFPNPNLADSACDLPNTVWTIRGFIRSPAKDRPTDFDGIVDQWVLNGGTFRGYARGHNHTLMLLIASGFYCFAAIRHCKYSLIFHSLSNLTLSSLRFDCVILRYY